MITRVVNWLFAAFLLSVGLYLTIRGATLISLGGSWYYTLAGLGLLGVVALLIMRNGFAGTLYAIIVAATVIWSIPEAGLDLLALLPRLMAWIVVGLWFYMPWYRSYVKSGGDSAWVGGASLVAVALLAISAFQKHPVVEFDRIVPEETVAEDDWVRYGKTDEGTRFSALTQITPENVSELEEVWRFETKIPYEFKATPIQIGRSLFTCTPGNIIISVDAATGEENWRYNPINRNTGSTWDELGQSNRFARGCRGVTYHKAGAGYEGACRARILTSTTDARLIAVSAETGEPCADFGENGEVDLMVGMGDAPGWTYNISSAPLLAGENIVVAGTVQDNQELSNPSGVIRAWNVVDGSFAWAFDVGRPGETGLPPEGEVFTRGTPNSWSTSSYDPELDLIYVPTGNASPDYYGAKRRDFDEEITAAVVALRGETGEKEWVYRTAYHDIWDYDVPSQPTLVDITKDGEQVPAVAVGTKQGEMFLLDRRDGSPIWPATECMNGATPTALGECPVPQDPAEGEWVSEVQPFSALPRFNVPRYEEDMWGMTPLDQLYCRIEFKKMRYEGHYTPPMPGKGILGLHEETSGGTFQYPGNQGGYNWTSSSVDADNGLLVVQPMLMGNRIILISEEERMAMRGIQLSDEEAASRRQAMAERADLTGQGAWDEDAPRYGLTARFMSAWKIPFTDIQSQTPCFEPPYGVMAVIDLNNNQLLWKRPIGKMTEIGPFGIKPGLPFEVGTPVYGGMVTTRSGLIFQVGTFDSTMRAIDIRNGKTLWETKLPLSANATPITYAVDGKQYVVASVPDDRPEGPTTGSQIIAYALPD